MLRNECCVGYWKAGKDFRDWPHIFVVEDEGLEPPTLTVYRSCSNQLS